MKKLIIGTLCIIIAVSSIGTACGKKKKELTNPIEITEVYFSEPFQVPDKNGFESSIATVLSDGDNFTVTVVYTDRKNSVSLTDVMTVDEKGETRYILELSGIQVPSAVFPNEYAFLGIPNSELANANNLSTIDCTAVFLNKGTGEVTKTVTPDFQAEFLTPATDGFVIGGQYEIAKYDTNGVCQGMIETEFPIARNSFFEDNGKYYVIGGWEDEEQSYYSLDFSNETTTEVASFRELKVQNVYPSNNYVFMAAGEYKVDLENKQLKMLVDWNNIDVRPPTKGLEEKEYIPLDDTHFAVKYIYGEDDSELLLLSKDESAKPVVKEKLTIGGTAIHADISLQWLVYQFNTSNTEYRVVLDEYARFYVGEDANELRQGQLQLMQYFNEGNTPDIFYGNTFDYDYMGRTGMVADLKPYLDQSDSGLDVLTDVAKNLMVNDDGTCYQVFSSYWLDGSFGLSRNFPNGSEISAFELYQISLEKDMLGIDSFGAEASRIVDEAIIYDFPNLWGIFDKNKKVSIEDLKKLLEAAIGMQDAAGMGSSTYQDGLANETTLLESGIVRDIYSFSSRENTLQDRLLFMGYPGINGSIHLAKTHCSMAMSTTTAHPDKCWELMSGIFSEQVQKISACSGVGEIPVNKNVLDALCNAAMKPESVTDEVIKNFVRNRKAVSQENVEDYLAAVSTADALFIDNRSFMYLVWDEVNSYYTQNRSTEQIARTLYERLELYAQENYS